jgi:hypothetical protein
LDLTTSEPSVVKVGDKWFMVIGSGPEDYDGDSTTTGKIFVLDLATGAPFQNGANDWLFETAEDDAFMATAASYDRRLNYNVDAIYIGETYDDSPHGWKGAMYKIIVPWTCTAPDCTDIQYGDVDPHDANDAIDSDGDGNPSNDVDYYDGVFDNNPANWTLTKLFDSPAPITGPPAISVDFSGNAWVYFGTGRYLSEADKASTDTQYLIGLKDPFFNSIYAPTEDPSVSPADDYYENYGISLTLDTTDLFDSDIYKVIHPWGSQDTPVGDCSAVPVGQTGDITGDGSCVCDYDWPVASCTEAVAGDCATVFPIEEIGDEVYFLDEDNNGISDDGCTCLTFTEPDWGCLDRVAGSCDSVPIAVVADNVNYHSFFYQCTESTEGVCLGVTLADIEGGYTFTNVDGETCTCKEITSINGAAIDTYGNFYSCTERPAGVCATIVDDAATTEIDESINFGDEGEFTTPTDGVCRAGYWACTEAVADSGACDTVDYTLTTGFLGAAGDGDYFGDGSCLCSFTNDPVPMVISTTTNLALTFDEIVDLARLEDGWIHTLIDPGERSVTKPAVLGGITLFSSYVPSSETCDFGGFSYLYALYFETGTAYTSNVFDPGVAIEEGVLQIQERLHLGLGMASSVGLHVGKQEEGEAKAFSQLSTGLIKDITLSPAFNIRSGLRYWKKN